MNISDAGRPPAHARNGIGYTHFWSARDFTGRDPLDIVLAGKKLGTTANVFVASCTG